MQCFRQSPIGHTVLVIGILWLTAVLSSCGPKWTETSKGDFSVIENSGGQKLGYSPASGMTIITKDRYAFKDLNRNGILDPYEDWRLDVDTRAKDLAGKMTIEQIAGLMLYSGHQRIPGGGFGRGGTYGGMSYDESGVEAWELTDEQKTFLTEDNLRHVLITSVESPEVAARWNNAAQALIEGKGLGIPANNSSDPRHEAGNDEEYTLGAGGDISRWPNSIGLAATFDPELVHSFGKIASREYRALGIATALSPQVDLATDPRWYRFSGTFGPSPELSTDMGRAYIDGFQTTYDASGNPLGWGRESVNAMVKHWPGGGSGEGGRDAHYGFGKFAVYPGDQLLTHIRPFKDGAFALADGTGKAAAVMPYYTISVGQDSGGDNVGNAFSPYMITDLLRETYGFDGVVCTDWGVTRDDAGMAVFGRTPWGVEGLTEAERHYRVLLAGGDQFGGNNDAGPVLEAYQMGVDAMGEAAMRARFEASAVRLLRNIFQVGLFENAYLDPADTRAVVGLAELMTMGYEAQLKSIVLLKNQGAVLPVAKRTTIYIPDRYVPESSSFFGAPIPARWEKPMATETVSKYFELTEDPSAAEMAIVVIEQPQNGRTAGYDRSLAETGDNGFLPITLQYGPYRATSARAQSLAGDSRPGDVLNRTYRGKEVVAKNQSDLDMIRRTVQTMKGKPVVVILKTLNPTVVAEFEGLVDGLIINFGVQDQAILDVISGAYTPTALLPLQMPADMETVENQMEDMPFDMVPYQDSEGHVYDFGYGLNWEGIISDERTAKYVAANPVESK